MSNEYLDIDGELEIIILEPCGGMNCFTINMCALHNMSFIHLFRLKKTHSCIIQLILIEIFIDFGSYGGASEDLTFISN